MLDEIGWAGAILVRQTPEGLVICDGHLRSETDPDADVPVLVTDLDEDEAAKLLATYDPIAAMAETDVEALRGLLATIETDSAGVSELLKRVEFEARIIPERPEKAPKPPPRPDPEMGDSLEPILRGEKQWIVLEGDVRDRLRDLPDGCVQTVVTSPPYWGLRDYGTAGWEGGDPTHEHRDRDVRAGAPGSDKQASNKGANEVRSGDCECGARRIDSQIGLEASFGAWIAEMVTVFAEVRRVLREDGTIWLNLGDAYASSSPGQGGYSEKQASNRGSRFDAPGPMQANTPRERPDLPNPPAGWAGRDVTVQRVAVEGVKQKDLLGQPWAVAFALRADGWYLRSEIIWAKPNPMPESVTDRPTKSHETVFLLSKRPTYFFDADAVRSGEGADARNYGGLGGWTAPESEALVEGNAKVGPALTHPNGANIRDVWTIATEAFSEAHFATFPRKLVDPCIRSATSEAGACATCGAPHRRPVDVDYHPAGGRGENEKTLTNGASDGGQAPGPQGMKHGRANKVVTTTGWDATCECEQDADAIGCIVLDPFNGSGTTGVVALGLGQRYIGIELSPEYAQMSRDRISRFREEQE